MITKEQSNLFKSIIDSPTSENDSISRSGLKLKLTLLSILPEDKVEEVINEIESYINDRIKYLNDLNNKNNTFDDLPF